jgi:hypothetical protein
MQSLQAVAVDETFPALGIRVLAVLGVGRLHVRESCDAITVTLRQDDTVIAQDDLRCAFFTLPSAGHEDHRLHSSMTGRYFYTVGVTLSFYSFFPTITISQGAGPTSK